MNDQRAILIAGPTASGKSALALRLAEAGNGTIINADSMQVYRELRILTARPSEEDEARVPHLLYGHVPASEAYSAGRYAREAAAAIAEVRAGGRRPVIVGGTGLYFRALTEGLSPVPTVPNDVRAYWRSEAAARSSQELHALLAARDPVMAARLNDTDPQRVTRALEVLDATGRSLAEWQSIPGEPVIVPHDAICLVAAPDRETLYARCNARFAAMIGHGAIEEVRALAALNLDPSLPCMRALGVEPLMQLLRGDIDQTEAIDLASAQTRQYAKRQVTWLRRNMHSWRWLDTQEMESKACVFL